MVTLTFPDAALRGFPDGIPASQLPSASRPRSRSAPSPWRRWHPTGYGLLIVKGRPVSGHAAGRAGEPPQLRCCGWPPSAELKSTVAGARVRVTVIFALPLLFL